MVLPPVAFSTLACPEWSAADVVARASALGYDAIEWRGGVDGHVDPRWTASDRALLRAQVREHGLTSLAVTAYPSLVTPDLVARAAHAADLIDHLHLAADLGAGAVRAFVGAIEDDASDAELTDRARSALAPVADRALELGVSVAIEPHDDFTRSETLIPILTELDHPSVGVIWELGNAWQAGEDPAVGGPALYPWIRYVQVKDGRGRGDDWRLTDIGDGEVPLLDAFRSLAARGPLPPISIEWERAWHPELAPAENALGPALAVVRALLGQAVGLAPPTPGYGSRR